MLEELKKAARALAYMRRGLTTWKKREADVVEGYKATLAYQAYEEVLAARKSLQALIKDVEGELRAMVLEHYAATKDKKPAPGLGVRESKGRTAVVYTDKDAALQWALENCREAVLLKDAVIMAMMDAAGAEIPGAHIVNEGAGILSATITSAAKLIKLYLEED